MTKKIALARTDKDGNLVAMSLVEWAQRFNETNRLPVKVAKK